MTRGSVRAQKKAIAVMAKAFYELIIKIEYSYLSTLLATRVPSV